MSQYLPLEAPPLRVPLRVSDVEMLDQRGAFQSYGKVELIEGELLYVNAQYRPHMVIKVELAYRLRRALEDLRSSLFVGTEGSVALTEHDLPQPDILLTSAPYGDGPIPGASVALLVEVSDTTLAFDLGRKAALYAGTGIPEYWVVDIGGGVIHQLWSPGGNNYAERREIAFGQRLNAVTVAGLAVATTKLSNL